ncbi:MAG: hypothetical protein JW888_00790 [Pirellulales bacterium]|nr:hypothetical protein [Pirellulales bacterium]
MARIKPILLLLLTVALCPGCGERALPPTLVIHVHDGVFDLIDHAGTVLTTVGDCDAVGASLEDPNVAKWVARGRVIIRSKGVRAPEGGLTPSEEAVGLCATLMQCGITQCHFDYAGKQDESP